MKTAFTPVLAALLAVSSALLPAPAAAQGTTTVDGIVAVVDEDVILRSELGRAVANIEAQYASQPGQLPPRPVLERQVLDRLVLDRLQLNRARGSGVRISDGELAQAIESVASRNRMTGDQLRQRLAADGISYEEFRTGLREEMMIERMRQRYVQSRVQVSEAEVDQLLAVREIGGPEVRLANIIVALPDGATPDEVAAANKKAGDIKSLIERGEIDFAAAAIRYSDAQNALEGGEIGWRQLDAIPPALVGLIQQLQPGQVSEPVRGPGGFQLIQLVETRAQSVQTITEYNALGILVRTTPTVTSEAARAKIEELRARIVAGEDFGALAREHSDDTLSRGDGGDMGWFQVNAWGTAVGNQLMQLQDGQLSEAFQTDVGWHLIRRLGSRQQDVTEQNRRNQAREIIAQRKSEEEYERFLRQLRSEAYVESRLPAP
ncbi:peptidylprolyl isomerase [Arenimonas caeni]|jgi:peptidyl-prolyl cis-trans isomerase SurA|uniref:Chaperone SurA n=1 Tax=Arenimonas caeni TaxID=2058085 RepID=A0A2P6MCT2_9GAMM|nr:peptidylprolyl isomerase [Arenimonas caeni]MDY0021216.1 peptidylprolyl isomerase [Arenimonas caeni]PRH83807.1 molecular chaperone SurA [Arenimonas caeni]